MEIFLAFGVIGFVIFLIFTGRAFAWHFDEWWRGVTQERYSKERFRNVCNMPYDPDKAKTQEELMDYVEDLVGKPRDSEYHFGVESWENGWTVKSRLLNSFPDLKTLNDPLPANWTDNCDEGVFELTDDNRKGYRKLRREALGNPQIQVGQIQLHPMSRWERWQFHVWITHPWDRIGMDRANVSPIQKAAMRTMSDMEIAKTENEAFMEQVRAKYGERP